MMSNFILALLSLVSALDLTSCQMHLISTHRIPSLTTEKCAIAMNSKHVDHILTTIIAYFESFKSTLDKKFYFGSDVEVMKYDPVKLDNSEAFIGKTPLLIKNTYLKGQHRCISIGGHLPEPDTDQDISVLSDLLTSIEAQFALIDIELDDLGLYYHSGKVMSWAVPVKFNRLTRSATLPSIDIVHTEASSTSTTEISAPISAKSTILNVSEFDSNVKSALHGFNPFLKKMVVLDKSKANENGKVICLVNRIAFLLGSNTNLTVQALKKNLINEIEILIDNYQLFREAMSSSPLNTNVEWAGALESSYSVPEFIIMSQELMTMDPHDFSSIGQTNFFKDLFVMTRMISEKIGESIALLSKSYINFPQGTCVISSGLQLECLCFNQNVKWSKSVIIPTEVSGKQLAFDNFAYATESKLEDGHCFTFKSNNHLLLSNECCLALRKLQDNAIDVCPITYTSNWSPISAVGEMKIIDNSLTSLVTTCVESIDKNLQNDDIYRLSLCEQTATSKSGNYYLPNLGKFLKDHLIKAVSPWYDVSKFTQREILIISIVGGVCGFVFLAIIVFLCIIFPRFRTCCCTLSKNICTTCCQKEEIRPIGRHEPAPEYEANPLMPTFGNFGAKAIV